MNLYDWARRNGVSQGALSELLGLMGVHPGADRSSGGSEAGAQKRVQLEASRTGCRLWRNNVGVLRDARDVPVRYGLANETPEMNKVIKSSDLIGIKPVRVSREHVGCTLGVFVAREMKAPGWLYTGTEREAAQLNYLKFVAAKGGDACFCTGEGTI